MSPDALSYLNLLFTVPIPVSDNEPPSLHLHYKDSTATMG